MMRTKEDEAGLPRRKPPLPNFRRRPPPAPQDPQCRCSSGGDSASDIPPWELQRRAQALMDRARMEIQKATMDMDAAQIAKTNAYDAQSKARTALEAVEREIRHKKCMAERAEERALMKTKHQKEEDLREIEAASQKAKAEAHKAQATAEKAKEEAEVATERARVAAAMAQKGMVELAEGCRTGTHEKLTRLLRDQMADSLDGLKSARDCAKAARDQAAHEVSREAVRCGWRDGSARQRDLYQNVTRLNKDLDQATKNLKEHKMVKELEAMEEESLDLFVLKSRFKHMLHAD